MKYILMIRARPSDEISREYEKFISLLSSLGNEWGFKRGAEIPKIKDPGTLPMRQINLSRCFQKGIKAVISFQNRKYHRDEGKFDDYFTLEFDPTKFNYELLATSVFERYIESFEGYRGEINNEEFIYLDFEKLKSIDYRSHIYRIHPVCFFDQSLCERNFHLTPEEIAKRVSGAVERVVVKSSGVLLVVSSKILTIEEANSINERTKWLIVGGPD